MTPKLIDPTPDQTSWLNNVLEMIVHLKEQRLAPCKILMGKIAWYRMRCPTEAFGLPVSCHPLISQTQTVVMTSDTDPVALDLCDIPHVASFEELAGR